MVKKKEFATATLNLKNKIFVIHIISLINFNDHLSHRAQIVSLKIDKTPIVDLLEYANFINILFLKLVVKLLEQNGINDHIINLINGK